MKISHLNKKLITVFPTKVSKLRSLDKPIVVDFFSPKIRGTGIFTQLYSFALHVNTLLCCTRGLEESSRVTPGYVVWNHDFSHIIRW